VTFVTVVFIFFDITARGPYAGSLADARSIPLYCAGIDRTPAVRTSGTQGVGVILIIERLLFRFSAKRQLRRLRVGVWALSSRREKFRAFEKLERALGVIEQYAPAKLEALQSDVETILVAGEPTIRGRYIHKLRMVELYDDYVLDQQKSPEALACTLIHEAQHARLRRLGFGYEEPIRGRIENLCFRAQRNFARLLPDGGELIDDAEAWMAADPELNFSNEAKRRTKLKALSDLGCPAWLIKLLDRISRRRAA
jgi:hypothetical protein